jgi:hypothetical protein
MVYLERAAARGASAREIVIAQGLSTASSCFETTWVEAGKQQGIRPVRSFRPADKTAIMAARQEGGIAPLEK